MPSEDVEEQILIESTGDGENVGVFFFDAETGAVGLSLYSEHFPGEAVEHRSWRAERMPSKKARQAITAEFNAYEKYPLTEASRRAIPWGRLAAAHRAIAGNAKALEAFKPPTDEAVMRCIQRDRLLGFRAGRDLLSAGQLLRVAKTYLSHVIAGSSTPTQDTADEMGLDQTKGRNLVGRAKRAGYIDTNSLLPTDRAVALAEAIWTAAEYAK